ncbi:PKD domain-containing protein [Trinickia violacea]|uniref:PKD domain-containing protein n=1 Tax=Trinickia violacea TaxID=2571746 RepID=UPI003F5CF6C8
MTYLWTQVSGPATVTLTGASMATPSFKPTVVGVYVFSLVVSDGVSSSKPATVKVYFEPANSCAHCNPMTK